jgi:uncharacterized LabA/DUF88 family protein
MGISGGGGGIDPYLRRWMLFVDGENFTIRAQDLAQKKQIALIQGDFYLEDVFVWLPKVEATDAIIYSAAQPRIQGHAIRSHFYTSAEGDGDRITTIRECLWKLKFHPEVFKKTRRDQKAKGVDIALSRDMLTHAFFNNYDVAILISGDGDYVPLVSEVKRLGKVVYVAFFEDSGLNPELRLSADLFADIGSSFLSHWRGVGK